MPVLSTERSDDPDSLTDLVKIERIRMVPVATPEYFKNRDEVNNLDVKQYLPKLISRGQLIHMDAPLSELPDCRRVRAVFKVMAINDEKGISLSHGRFDTETTEVFVSRTPIGHRLKHIVDDEVQFNKEQMEEIEEICSKELLNTEPGLATFLLKGPSGFGKRSALDVTMKRLGVPLFKPIGVTKEKFDANAVEMAQYQPCCIQVDHSDFNRVYKKLAKVPLYSCIFLVSVYDGLDAKGLDGILHVVNFPLISKAERESVLSSFLPEELVSESVLMTTGLSLADMFMLKKRVLYKARMKTNISIELLSELVKQIRLSRTKQSALTQKVTWDQVAGLEEAKRIIRETLDFPLNKKLSSALGRRTGILLHGPPGTGKTLLAKAIATEYQLSFMSVKGPELMSMYIGETESNIRDLFLQARLTQPTVLFFDELDSLATRRGEDADSGGITDRIVAQLMVEIDRLVEDVGCTVFLIGATNRPDLIDPVLLRPGRIDKAVYLGAPASKSEQVAILRASCHDMLLDESVRFEDLDQLGLDYSPADLANVCRSAMRLAIRSRIEELENGVGTPTDLVKVTQDNFKEACKLVKPSLTTSK